MKKRNVLNKASVLLLTAAMTAALLNGCGSANGEKRKDAADIKADNAVTQTTSTESESKTESESVAAETSASESAARTQYPLTITTYGSDGTELSTTYQKAPSKVLAVYQGSIETMLSLGLGDHIVAAAGLDNEVPDQLKADFSKLNYLDEFTPSLETVTMLEPDMILSWGSLFQEKTLGDAKGWADKGVNPYINTNTRPATGDTHYPRTLEHEYTDIENLGKIFDVQDKANTIVNRMKDTITNVTDQTSDLTDKPTVLILESYDNTFTNYGSLTLGGDMVTKLGGVLANPDGDEIGKEDIIAANPDVIFVVYMPYAGDDPETVKQQKLDVLMKDPAYASLDAVKNNRVVPIMLSEMYASATRTQSGIEDFAKGLYPDITLDK